ncbi:MAG: OmpA family protein [Acidobacteriota bacterium]|nr:OmpA family protein [Acidobacteriota bacterium]
MKTRFLLALPLMATMALPMTAQQSATPDSQPPAAEATAQASNDRDLEPLKPANREGFWGRMNPFARKKYVQRQLTPLRDRANELDELTANNSRMLKDVDARATAGIRRADEHASLADQHALDAQNRAQAANQLAQQADTRLQNVSQVVDNLDQYKSESQIEIRFRPGAITLSTNAKDALDKLAEAMKDQKGYVVEIQGFAPGHGTASIQQSQRLADAVVRYLVINHQIPVYRIYELGLGNASVENSSADARPAHTSRVEITLLRNGVNELAQGQGSIAQ